MDFLGSHRKDKEETFNEICDIKGVDKTKVYSPNQILNGICGDKELFQTSFGKDSRIDNIYEHLDRCLVASLASTLKKNSNIIETGTFTDFASIFIRCEQSKIDPRGLLLSIDLPTSSQATYTHNISISLIGSQIPDKFKKTLFK